jgi:hypothetical protein
MPVGLEAGWALEPGWVLCRREECNGPTGNQILSPTSCPYLVVVLTPGSVLSCLVY